MEINELTTVRLLTLRQTKDSKPLVDLIEKNHGKCVNWQALELLKEPSPSKEKQERIKLSDYFIFTSKPSVIFGVKWLKDTKNSKVLAVGSATAKELKNNNVSEVIVPEIETSEGLLQADALRTVRKKVFTIFKGVDGRDLLEKTLIEKGAKVIVLDVYRREESSIEKEKVFQIKSFSPNFVHITSKAIAESFNKAIQKFKFIDLKKAIVLVPSDRVKKKVLSMGFSKVVTVNSMRKEETLKYIKENTP